MCYHAKISKGLKNKIHPLCDIWPINKHCVKHFGVSTIHAPPCRSEAPAILLSSMKLIHLYNIGPIPVPSYVLLPSQCM